MPKPKKHTGFHVNLGFWCRDVLDEFIKDYPLPRVWGGNSMIRYAAACALVEMAVTPEALATPKAYIDINTDLRVEIDRHVRFADLFARAPSYFLSLLVFVREKVEDQSQLEKIAMQLRMNRSLLDHGASDKEIARALEEKLRIFSIHPSMIGKARKLLAERDELGKRRQGERLADAVAQILPELYAIQQQRRHMSSNKTRQERS